MQIQKAADLFLGDNGTDGVGGRSGKEMVPVSSKQSRIPHHLVTLFGTKSIRFPRLEMRIEQRADS